MTQAEISRQTGIPTSTVSYVLREERNLPAQYNPGLRNAFQREAYHNLREAGLSSTQADRFKWYVPGTVTIVTEQTTGIVGSIVDKRMEAYSQYLKSQGTYISEEDTRARLMEAIAESIQKSELPYERILSIEYRNTSELGEAED